MIVRSDHPARPRRRLALAAALAAACLAVGLAAVYGIGGFARNPGDPACAPALATAKRIAPLARGEVAAVKAADTGQAVAPLAFKDARGEPRTLADWRGRVVLLNLWATWCIPCRKEMPALDALQEKLGGPRFEVVAVNIDTRDPDKPRAFLDEIGVRHLAYFADPSAKVFQDIKAAGGAIGLPTTLLIDASGCELASIAGPAEWASDDAVKLIQAALAPAQPAR